MFIFVKIQATDSVWDGLFVSITSVNYFNLKLIWHPEQPGLILIQNFIKSI